MQTTLQGSNKGVEGIQRGVLFRKIPGAMAHKIVILGLNMDTKGNVEKAHISARG